MKNKWGKYPKWIETAWEETSINSPFAMKEEKSCESVENAFIILILCDLKCVFQQGLYYEGNRARQEDGVSDEKLS